MFDDMTFDELLEKKLESIDDKYDKREGSIIYDALAPNSAEDAELYFYMSWLYDQMHIETAERESLIQLALDLRGLTPKVATNAVLKAKFNIAVGIGERFSGEELNYTVNELINDDTHEYKIECETVGEVGNSYIGEIIPLEYIPDLETAEITEILLYGEDEEDTDAFRARFRNSFNGTAFGGNKASYKDEIKKISGVGGVKVDRATNSEGKKVGGYVLCTVITSNYSKPSIELIESIQNVIDPTATQGDGDGIAPIGATATIQAVGEVVVNVSATITYDTGYSFETLEDKINEAVEMYLYNLRKTWEDNGKESTIVRLAKIESAILNVDGIIDISDTTLNGAAENITVEKNSIAVRGEVHG